MVKEVTQFEIEIVDLDDDAFPFTNLSNRGTSQKTAISVEQYSEDRDLLLAIIASRTKIPETFIDLSEENQDCNEDDLRVLYSKPKVTLFGKQRKPFINPSVTETGQSSKSKIDPPFLCEICTEPKSSNESFSIQGCSHAYCTNCMINYVASKLQENITSINCPVPNCSGSLQPEHCRSILPQEVFDRWGNALCEAVILGSEKFYCPFKDCSVLLIDDNEGEVIRESECPYCRRLFCAQCKVPWHAGIDCAEFQKLNKDEREKEDIMLMKLAQESKWSRCPRCRFYVEKSEGCMYMKCRCGIAFCYGCGTLTTRTDHYCPKCRR